MASFNIEFLVGVEEADLLVIKANAITAIKNGNGSVTNVSSFSAPNLTVNYFTSLSPAEVLQAANYALNKLNKKTVRRTVARFV